MFGLPEQTTQEMINDVQTAINQNPSHISFYQLTLEPNTYFHKYPPAIPEDEQIFSGQLQCQQLLAEAGYMQYEISAYAKNNTFCQHNLNYWKFGDYLGIGAGAHGKISILKPENIIRTVKPRSPEQYLIDSSSVNTQVSKNELPIEFVMNLLRLKTGFSLEHYRAATGLDSDSLEPALSTCINEKLLIEQKGLYFCSEKGWNFLDDILEKFMT
jgi:oxygen-independent coproporphyrinogen-3 oxidase